MRKIMLSALTLFMILATASPAMASLAGNAPAYQVEGNTVTIDGDMQTDCRSFSISLREGTTFGLSRAQQREVLSQCQEQGVAAPKTSTMPLPDTGGPSLLLLEVGLALAGLGAMGLRISCRTQ